MGKVNYLLLDMSVLPEVYVKVIEAKGYLQSGEAANASQAIKMPGISCSAYYKYKDKILCSSADCFAASRIVVMFT